MTSLEPATGHAKAGEKKIAILGLPNAGKSLIFKHLAGKYSIIANHALTTIEPLRCDCSMNGLCCQVIDTPGIRCLRAHSEEERAIRNLVFRERPDLILRCIDAVAINFSALFLAGLLYWALVFCTEVIV